MFQRHMLTENVNIYLFNKTSGLYIWLVYFSGSNMSARQGQLICSMYMLNHFKYT